MPVIFKKADEELCGVMRMAMEKYHADLVQADFKVAVREATNEDADLPALKVHGHAAAARIKRVATRDYLLIQADAIIDVDLRVWEGLNDAQRLALFDHELSHVGLRVEGIRTDGTTQYETDDNIRPKWSMIPHDYNLSGFAQVIARHKKNAVEVLSVKLAAERCSQLTFAFEQTRKALPA